MGLPNATNQVLVDGVDMLRRLWDGQRVSYDGPVGTFPAMELVDRPDVAPPPIALTAIGPKSLALAGAHFDGVLLHAFLTPEAQARAAESVHKAAADAGRDPGSVKVYGMVVVSADDDARTVEARVRARLVTYLNAPGLNVSLVAANGWDPAVLDAIAAHPLIVGLRGGTADAGLTIDELIDVSRVVPDAWFEDGAAVGSADEVAGRLRTYLANGADEMILHGSTPDLLGPVLDAFTSTAGAGR
jgi:probable F420-dependent oxidoreductase